ncbi:ribose ABC transporter permease [Actinoallomurus liliacearum]|uniref:Ribose ABC transporter permease n=1 Tax=Actinoallomurus liliacearum TaxID=1080073 RepID=A0ABP8TPD3_9ACTN
MAPESTHGESPAQAPSPARPALVADTVPQPARTPWLRDPARRPGWPADLSMLPALVLLIAVLSLFTDGLLTPSNITNVFSQSAVVAIAAIGATFVILTGGIDLSTGSVIGASGVAGAWIITSTHSVAVGIAAGLLTGTAIGLAVGVVVARLPVVPFAVTLAALYVVSGGTTLLSHGKTIAPVPAGFIDFSIDGPGGVPYAVWLAVGLYVLAQLALTRTAWGRRVVYVGANAEVARISGVDVARTKTSVYAVAGLSSAMAGMVLTSGLAGAGASMGSPLLLNIVGAVVLGGTSLFGGRGSMLRTGIGVLFLGFLSNGMSLLGLPSYDQQIVTGVLIFAAASADGLLRRLRPSLTLA